MQTDTETRRPVSPLNEGALVATGPGSSPRVLAEVRPAGWANAVGLRMPSNPLTGTAYFVVETSTGLRRYGRLVGTTVRRFGLDCPEVYLYDVATVAVEGDDGTFALWGVLGDRVRMPGPVFTRPENVVAV